MPTYETEPRGDEEIESCPDCGRSIYEGMGILIRDGSDLATYAYRWSEGHESRFSLAIAGVTDGVMRDGFVVVSSHSVGDDLHFSVVDPADAPWGDTEEFGRVLNRNEALNGSSYPDLFDLVDAITQYEPRLVSRITTSHGA